MTVKLYNVGGAIRDNFLGRRSKDIDLAAEANSWGEILAWAEEFMDSIYQIKDEFLTIKGCLDGKDLDVVMCRKEGYYTDSRRPDNVLPGSLLDDLSRRDFTINALAVPYGRPFEEAIDYFGGVQDLDRRLIRCVGRTKDRFDEDPLRLLRAFRFAITLGFDVHPEIESLLDDHESVLRILTSVKSDRIREELSKCFRFDTEATIGYFAKFPKMISLFSHIAKDSPPIWLMPTTRIR